MYRFRGRQRFQSKIAKLAMRLCGTTLPISVGCKIITYLESQTHSFLLTVQLSSGYDDDLLSITAIVKHFQTGKNRFRPPA